MSRNFLHRSAANDLLTFTRLAFDVRHPGKSLKLNWHHQAVAAVLNQAMAGSRPRQLVTMPPRTLKSFIISVAFPAFLMGQDPAVRIVCASYGDKLAEELSEATQQLMQSDFYRSVFPGTRLRTATKQKLTTTRGGMRFATSFGGAMTGFGGDWVIIDDPLNAADAYSEAARERVNRTFDRSLSSRVDDETTSRFIIAMQRLHADDLAGHVLATGDWREFRLPAKATERIEVDLGAAGRHVFQPGELLHPVRLPQAVLDRKQRELGSTDYEAQFQQNPVPAEGVFLKRKWLRYYDQPPAREGGRVVISLDTATKTNPANDYSVATTWLMKEGNHSLLEVWRDKVEYPDLRTRMIDLYNQHRADTLLIEDQGNGTALAQELARLGIAAIPRKTPEGKVSRFVAGLSQFERGQVWFPREAPWLGVLVAELLAFPSVPHDDQADSVSQYLAWAREQPLVSDFSYEFLGRGQPTTGAIADFLISRNWR